MKDGFGLSQFSLKFFPYLENSELNWKIKNNIIITKPILKITINYNKQNYKRNLPPSLSKIVIDKIFQTEEETQVGHWLS